MSIFSRMLDAEPAQPARPALAASLRAADDAEAERDRRLELERLAIAMAAVQKVEAMAGRAAFGLDSAEALAEIKALLDRLFRRPRAGARSQKPEVRNAGVDMAALERAVDAGAPADEPPPDPQGEPAP